jgi:hypothetical protein
MTNEIDAPHGDKMIEITIKFWTNDIAKGEGKVLPKHMHNSGMIKLSANKTHNIPSEDPTPFGSMAELPSKIEELLERHKIIMHCEHSRFDHRLA